MALFAVVLTELVAVAVGWWLTGLSGAAALESFMVPNATIGACCGVCGVLIAAYRPANRLGWLLLGAAVCQTATAAVTPWLVQALQVGAPEATVRWLATVYSAAWPWSIALFIPLALLSFPSGHLPGPRWRWLVPVVAVNGVVQVLLFSADADPLATVAELAADRRGAPSYLALGWLPFEGTAEFVSELVLSATFLAALLGLLWRYRRGTEQVRRQLLWLLFAATVAVALVALLRLGGPIEETGFPVVILTAIALIPIAMTIAVLRHRLLDIRLVWSRALTYALLTAAVVVAYLLLVQVGDQLLRQEVGLGTSVLATLVVAAAFHPVRSRLQRGVDRLLYGQRTDPVRAATTVSAGLAGAQQPAEVLSALCQALRLPYARLADVDRVVGEHGVRPEQGRRVPRLRGGPPRPRRRVHPEPTRRARCPHSPGTAGAGTAGCGPAHGRHRAAARGRDQDRQQHPLDDLRQAGRHEPDASGAPGSPRGTRR